MLSADNLKKSMTGFLADPMALHAPELFESVAKAFNSCFQIFKASTLVQKVMGMGPVPGFAPPFSPAGPVMGGFVIPAPGVFV